MRYRCHLVMWLRRTDNVRHVGLATRQLLLGKAPCERLCLYFEPPVLAVDVRNTHFAESAALTIPICCQGFTLIPAHVVLHLRFVKRSQCHCPLESTTVPPCLVVLLGAFAFDPDHDHRAFDRNPEHCYLFSIFRSWLAVYRSLDDLQRRPLAMGVQHR